MPAAEPSLAEDLALVTEVAREAGALSLDWLKRGAKSWEKSPDNPVTEADLAVNDLISKRLRSARPGYGWLSEETRDNPADRTQVRTFVVDPIDGTKAFLRHEPGYCISIARLEGGQPVVGALFNPLTDELFCALAGGGARLNGQPIKASVSAELEGARMILRPEIAARLKAHPAWPAMEFLSPIPNSIAWRIALVACGRWDAAIGIKRTNDWDVAAAALILSEAGGIGTDGEGAAFVFNQAVTQHPGVVAAGANLHPLLMDRLREMGRRP